MAERIWSQYQKTVFNFVQNGTGNAVVRAVPGSGKTTTIVEAAKLVPKGSKSLFVAFSSLIVRTLKEQLPKDMKVMTLHGFGLSIIGRRRRVDVDEFKGSTIAHQILGAWDGRRAADEVAIDPYASGDNCEAVRKAASLAKGMCLDPEEIAAILDDFEIESKNLSQEQIAQAAFEAMKLARKSCEAVDYDDMIWIPYVDDLPIPQYDYIFVDETQDLNAGQLHLVLSAAENGRVIAVGDPRQAIYAFRGADSGAMDRMGESLRAMTLPLSVCYRCAKSIVREIQKIEPRVEAAPDAVEGVVRELPIDRVLSEVKGGDFIVSRTNAPLVSLCFQLLAQGRPAYIQGRDVGKSLKVLIEKSKAKTTVELIAFLDEWYLKECLRLREKKRSTANVEDRRACLEALCEGRASVREVEAAIDAAFIDAKDNAKIRLSSTHRAKGMEADRVFMLVDTFHAEDSEEEANLVYVATSRAKSELVYVNGMIRQPRG
jgi:DNA helicase II / ATP-dependent DNA helicase PcrA